MSEYEGLREDIGLVAQSLASYSATVTDHAAHTNRQIKRLWEDNAALRDELHALANRVEGLTRAVTTEPAEVASKWVKWRECSECGTVIYRATDGMIRDEAGLHTCKASA